MDLRSGYPYFLLKNGLLGSYDQLQADHHVDVVILGGGISGALVAHELTGRGIGCTVIDARPIAFGSSAASTSLLQYEIDVPLHQLIKKIGKANAERAYKLCSYAIDKLMLISDEIGYDAFRSCSSLYFSDGRSHRKSIEAEFNARSGAGFDVSLLDAKEIASTYGLKASNGILSTKAAKMDAYRFVHKLLQYNQARGLRVYEDTTVRDIRHNKSEVIMKTERGHTIRAGKVIYATGYEVVSQVSKNIVKLYSTYACISRKNQQLPTFFRDTLFWNTGDPYFYWSEDDSRIMIGGRDEPFYNPEKRDRLLPKKSKQLEGDVKSFFGDIEFEAQFCWTGTFGTTKDGLPYIGTYSKLPNSYFALGFGGNGITFSALAGEIIADLITTQQQTTDPLFSFNR